MVPSWKLDTNNPILILVLLISHCVILDKLKNKKHQNPMKATVFMLANENNINKSLLRFKHHRMLKCTQYVLKNYYFFSYVNHYNSLAFNI